jgi:hypothetical protein
MDKKLWQWLTGNDTFLKVAYWFIKDKIECIHAVYARSSPKSLVWVVTRRGVMTRHDCVRFSLFCTLQVEDGLTDERSLEVIHSLAGWLAGTVTRDEMRKTAMAAEAAASHLYAVMDMDAYYAARVAACAASVAVTVTAGACGSVCYYTSCTAVKVVGSAARKVQADWIRKNIPFESLDFKLKG